MSAGSSSRFRDKNTPKKQWLRINDDPLWLFVTSRFTKMYNFGEILITASKEDVRYMKNYTNYKIVEGGDTRAKSLLNALEYVETEYVLVSDTARACIPESVIKRVLEQKGEGDCIVPYLPVSDTTVYNDQYIDRNRIKLIQTPQLSRASMLKKGLKNSIESTDESSAIKAIGGEVIYILGDTKSHKLTFQEDYDLLDCLSPPKSVIFTGNGLDFHKFEDGKKMVLGGVEIESDFGFKAHSDGDVLLHALSDALLGAIGGGDIGEWFPDNDLQYKGIDSATLLKQITYFIVSVGYEIINIDITMICETPRLSNYKDAIKENLANLLEIQKNRINIKATTTEKMGFLGRQEGAGCSVSANLRYYRWKK